MKKPILYMMVGIPASGKSTLAKEYAEKYNAKVFSSDEYRKTLLGDESCQDNNELVFKSLFTDMYKHLSSGGNVIFDACNTTAKSRARVIRNFSDITKIIAVVVMASYEECCKRDASRSRTVGMDVIKKFISAYEFPQHFEGFANIEFVNTHDMDYRRYYSQYLHTKAIGFHQHSKYHKYDVATHQAMVTRNVEGHYDLFNAASYHDYGKLYTRKFGEDGYAHYYGHEHWSAYLYATTLDFLDDSSLFTVFIINYHMKIRDVIKSEKALNKYGKLWGGYRLARLIQFMEADNKGSGREEN